MKKVVTMYIAYYRSFLKHVKRERPQLQPLGPRYCLSNESNITCDVTTTFQNGGLRARELIRVINKQFLRQKWTMDVNMRNLR